MATALGPQPFGPTGPNSGPGVISVLGVAPLSTNAVAVVFDVPLSSLDDQAWFSGSNPTNYTLAVDPAPPPPYVAPTRQPSVVLAVPDPDYPTQVVLYADVGLEPLTLVTVTVSSQIRGDQGETFAGQAAWSFGALLASGAPVSSLEARADEYSDLAYVVTGPAGAQTQVLGLAPNGDLARQGGAEGLRKRIYRRVFGSPGDYAWDGEYGVGVSVKGLARAGRLQELASRVAEQVRLEPDVSDASAEVRVDRRETGTFVLVDLSVLRSDRAAFRFGFAEAV